MDRLLLDELIDDMEQAWAETIPARARQMYSEALAGIEPPACRDALAELVLEPRERRPSPGVLRTRALALVPEARRSSDAERSTNGEQAPARPDAPMFGSVPAPIPQEAPIAGPAAATHSSTAKRPSGWATAGWLTVGGLVGSAFVGGLISLLWIGMSAEPAPENLSGVSGLIGLVVGLGVTWALLAASDGRRDSAQHPAVARPTAMMLMAGALGGQTRGGAPPSSAASTTLRPTRIDPSSLMAGPRAGETLLGAMTPARGQASAAAARLDASALMAGASVPTPRQEQPRIT